MPVGGDAVQVVPGNLRHQPVAAKLGDEAGDLGTATAGLVGIAGEQGPQPLADVGVAEPDDRGLPRNHGPERGEVPSGDRVEPGVAAPSVASGPAQSVERGDPVSVVPGRGDRKSTRLNSSHVKISYAVFCLKK